MSKIQHTVFRFSCEQNIVISSTILFASVLWNKKYLNYQPSYIQFLKKVFEYIPHVTQV